MKKVKYTVAGLIAAVLLATGVVAGYAAAQAKSPTDNNHTGSTSSAKGMGSMMTGKSGMGSMMDNGRAGSMMRSQGMAGGQAMGTFDKNKPFDLQFIDQMTMHHEGAIMSAKNMISDSKRPELRKLAQNIEKGQSEQVKQMQAWRKQWYPGAKRTFGMMDPTQMQSMMGSGQMQQMMGGSMRQMMGADTTDEMFLQMMIPHHQMAVDMSEKALKQADHPELRKLAQKIKDEQSAQIKQMKGYLQKIEAADES